MKNATNIQEAIHFHRLQNFVKAEQLYKKILKEDPRNFDALHHLGILYCATSQFEKSFLYLKKAEEIDNNFPPLLNSIGNTLIELNKSDDAIRYFERAILLQPIFPTAYFNLGVAFTKIEKLTDAITAYEKAIMQDKLYLNAINNLGNIYLKQGKTDEAISYFNKCLILSKDYYPALINRSTAYEVKELFHMQIDDLLKVNLLLQNNLEILIKISNAYLNLNQIENSKKYIEIAKRNHGNSTKIQHVRALIEYQSKNYIEALNICDTMIIKKSKKEEFFSLAAASCIELQKSDLAIKYLESALNLFPKSHDIKYNFSLIKLRKKEFSEGFKLYESRKFMSKSVWKRLFDKPQLTDINNIKNKTIFVYEEQGFGDVFQFCRFLLVLINRGANIIFGTSKNFEKILSLLHKDIKFVDREKENIEFDYYCSIMDLPSIIKLKFEELPYYTSYLNIEKECSDRWNNILGTNGFKIGINWQGRLGAIDHGRSFALNNFKKISKIHNVRLISIQKVNGIEQIDDFRKDCNIEIFEDLDKEFLFYDTAAVMKCCDLIITSDSANAHLAGALGVPTWTILKNAPDWRWFDSGIECPWYPSMKLYRQNNSGDWSNVFDNIEKDLIELVKFKFS